MEKIIFNNIEFYKIKDFDKYYISKCGKVLSTKKHNGTNIRILSQFKTPQGYVFVVLHDGISRNNRFIHRLLSQTFIPNTLNKSQVNHINGIKNDNRLENLEWCTRSENQLHAYKLGLQIPPQLGKCGIEHHNSKKVKQLDLKGNLIKVWNSISDIKRELKIHNISGVCKHKNTQAGGFKWEYV